MKEKTLLAAIILSGMAANPRQLGGSLAKMVVDALSLASMLRQEAERWWPEEYEPIEEESDDED